MARKLTTSQQQMAADVLELSSRRSALMKQLAEIEEFQHQAIALAEQFGVRQTVLATVAGLTPGRISQIVRSTVLSEVTSSAQRIRWRRALEWPQDRLYELMTPTTDKERQEVCERREAIYGGPDKG